MDNETPLLMIPGPTNVAARVMNAMQKPMINHRGPEFQDLYKRILENLKYVFQTRNDVFPISSSGTGGVECAIANLVSKGDKILTPTYGIFTERLREDVIRFGGVPVDISCEWGTACTATQVKEALDKMSDIKIIAIVYNETSTGVTVRDLEKIGDLARKEGKILIVDAVSILGGDKLPVDDWGIDICVTGSQKCLACPPGLAMVSVSPKAYEVMEGNNHRPLYFDILAHREYGSKLETPYTPFISLYFALDEALLMVKEEGLEHRIRRHKMCADAFYVAFDAMKLNVVAKDGFRSNVVLAAHEPPGVDDRKLRETTRVKYRVTIGGGMGKLKGKIFRIGSMGIVSRKEVLTTLEALGNTMVEQGYGDKEMVSSARSKAISVLDAF